MPLNPGNNTAVSASLIISQQVLEAALDYRDRGWSIIPIAAGTKKPPKRFGWRQYQKQLPSEQDLRFWFTDRDDLGIAVVLGEVSGGLVCRDFDDKKSYQTWKKAHPDLAQTLPTVKTKRGFHVYFRTPSEHLVFKDLRPHQNGEYRGDSGHYCLLPPSQHPDGSTYDWAVPLPQGEVSLVDDVVAAGFFPTPDVTQKAQGRPKKSRVISRPCTSGGERRRLSASQQIVVEEAINRTIPSGPGNRRRAIFELARLLKFDPEFAEITTTQLDFLKPSLKKWWKQAEPYTSGTHPYFLETWQDFVFAWEEARVPVDATMQQFMDAARSMPAPERAVELYGEGTLRTLLVSLCSVLQQHAGDKPFPLACRTVGTLLGVSATHASRWLKTLAEDGFIKPEKTYPMGKRLATEWLYVGD